MIWFERYISDSLAVHFLISDIVNLNLPFTVKNVIRSLKSLYYMEKSVLRGTKPLVDSIRHFIRDLSGVFSICHLCECRIVQ